MYEPCFAFRNLPTGGSLEFRHGHHRPITPPGELADPRLNTLFEWWQIANLRVAFRASRKRHGTTPIANPDRIRKRVLVRDSSVSTQPVASLLFAHGF